LELAEVVEAVRERSGLAIPAHVDRTAYGLYGVLGFLPEDTHFPVVEVSKRLSVGDARIKYPDLNGRAIVSSSDAHMLEDIGTGRTVFYLEHRSVEDIIMAVEGHNGRRLENR
jgi:PHP family Zn ribbon phosphoesterase